MDKDFLILFKPVVDAVPVKRTVILQVDRRHFIERRLIGPDGIFGCLAAGLDCPVGGVPLVLTMTGVTGRMQNIEPDVLHREVIDWQVVHLIHQHHVRRVRDPLPAEFYAHAAR